MVKFCQFLSFALLPFISDTKPHFADVPHYHQNRKNTFFGYKAWGQTGKQTNQPTQNTWGINYMTINHKTPQNFSKLNRYNKTSKSYKVSLETAWHRKSQVKTSLSIRHILSLRQMISKPGLNRKMHLPK